MVLFHAFENFLLIIPALYAYGNIKERHQFIEETIGALPLESTAMQRWQWIVTLAPCLVIFSIPLELGLIWIFNKYGHPWKRFFGEFSQRPKKMTNIKAVATSYIVG